MQDLASEFSKFSRGYTPDVKSGKGRPPLALTPSWPVAGRRVQAPGVGIKTLVPSTVQPLLRRG